MKECKTIFKFTAITIALVALHQGAQSSESELQPAQCRTSIAQQGDINADDLYQKALNFRDSKVEGYTLEESRDKAAELFFELAKSGNSKAMHNYALIEYNKKNYEPAYKWFKKAGFEASKKNCERMIRKGEVKKSLYLVVGSTRESRGSFGPFIDAIYGHNNADMSHRNTFGGKATTFDCNDSELTDLDHIRGDATQFDFAAKYNVKSVLLEKFPTLGDKDHFGYHLCQEDTFLNGNYTGRCIKQIAKAMRPQAPMEIEWLPYTSLIAKTEGLQDLIATLPVNSITQLSP